MDPIYQFPYAPGGSERGDILRGLGVKNDKSYWKWLQKSYLISGDSVNRKNCHGMGQGSETRLVNGIHNMTSDKKQVNPQAELVEQTKQDDLREISDSRFEEIDQELQSFADEYLNQAADEIRQMRIQFSELCSNVSGFNQILSEIYSVAHGLKGTGGTFGYDLITNVSDRLCRFTENISDEPDDFTLEVISLHISSLGVITANKLIGDGGSNGRSLLAGLDQINKKWLELRDL